jgi:hypothetical protein
MSGVRFSQEAQYTMTDASHLKADPTLEQELIAAWSARRNCSVEKAGLDVAPSTSVGTEIMSASDEECGTSSAHDEQSLSPAATEPLKASQAVVTADQFSTGVCLLLCVLHSSCHSDQQMLHGRSVKSIHVHGQFVFGQEIGVIAQ